MFSPQLAAHAILVLLNDDITVGYADDTAPSAEPLHGTPFIVHAAILSYDNGWTGGEIRACTDTGHWYSVRALRLRNGAAFSRNADGSWAEKEATHTPPA